LKFKERYARFKKEFFVQYDIMTMMNIGPFEYKDFIIKELSSGMQEITLKSLNYWYFNFVFDNKDVMCEFFFFYYRYNFYPKMGGWRRDQEGTRYSMFNTIKMRIEEGIKKRENDTNKL